MADSKPVVELKASTYLVQVPATTMTAAPQSASELDLANSLVSAMPWLDAMWLAGVLIFSVRTAGGWYVIRTLRRSGLVAVPAEVRSMFSRLASRIGIKRRIDLYISERISGPLAMGVIHSVVLLPVSAVTHLTPGQLEVVLVHELAHIRRGDYLWNMVQTMAETLFFFHPAVWWVSGSLRQQRELCCDDVALACCSDPVVYATALLCLEEQRGSKMRLAMALDGHQHGLKARIFRILGEAPDGRRQIAPLSLVGVCAMVGLFLLPLPRLFADRALSAEPIPAAVVTGLQNSRITGPQIAQAESSVATPAVAPTEVTVPAATPTRAARPAVTANPPARETHGLRPLQTARSLPTNAVAAATIVVNVSPVSVAVEHLSHVLVAPHAIAMLAMQQSGTAAAKSDYITEMRAAGYGNDLDELIQMKIQGVTPEYARKMEQLGFGKPTARELVSLKIFGVTPETVQAMKASGITPTTLHDLIKYQIFKVTPEYVAGMKAAGFGDLSSSTLVKFRVHGITPESAKATKQQFPDVTADQLVQLQVFHIDSAFIASAKQHGFDKLTIDKLVKLRISGLLDDSDQKAEKK